MLVKIYNMSDTTIQVSKKSIKTKVKKIVSKVLTKSIISIILKVSNRRNESFDTKWR